MGHDLSYPVFTAQRGGSKPVSKRTMLSRLQKAVQLLGLPKDMFGLHSFRHGGAAAAASNGVYERMIEAHGRWISDVVRVYHVLCRQKRCLLAVSTTHDSLGGALSIPIYYSIFTSCLA